MGTLKKILAIDPGQSTGWCVIEGRTKEAPYFNHLGWGTLKGWASYETMLTVYGPKVDVIVIEAFHARPEFLMRLAKSRKWVRMEEPEKVGYAKGVARTLHKVYVEHQPSDLAIGHAILPGTKHTSDTDKHRHQKDALAHAAVYNHRVLGNLYDGQANSIEQEDSTERVSHTPSIRVQASPRAFTNRKR